MGSFFNDTSRKIILDETKGKMMLSATHEAKRCNIPIARIHTSSANDLNAVIAKQFGTI